MLRGYSSYPDLFWTALVTLLRRRDRRLCRDLRNPDRLPFAVFRPYGP